MQKSRSTLPYESTGDKLSQDPNLRLVEQAKAGNRQAFERLWNQHEGKAKAVVCAQLQCSSGTVSEVMQQVRLHASRAISRLNGHARFPNWLCQIALWEATTYSNRHTQGHDGLSARPQLNGRPPAEMLANAERTIEAMGKHQQEILRLVCRGKRSPAEVAGSLGVTQQDVYEAVKVFRRKWRGNMKEPK